MLSLALSLHPSLWSSLPNHPPQLRPPNSTDLPPNLHHRSSASTISTASHHRSTTKSQNPSATAPTTKRHRSTTKAPHHRSPQPRITDPPPNHKTHPPQFRSTERHRSTTKSPPPKLRITDLHSSASPIHNSASTAQPISELRSTTLKPISDLRSDPISELIYATKRHSSEPPL
ncbi:36.4 kDa proline-rich protein-like [Quercus suber]|uniref:36.4 kDa proline-rich protein-like n=1 Tax=Quercus suber TaxID=58331 RepID=UPI0032E00429